MESTHGTTPAERSALPAITARTLSASVGAAVVDLRSPVEFAEDHVPGAINVPLLDDDERALVGTLYRRASPDKAFERGRLLVAERIEALVGAIARRADWAGAEVDLRERVLALTWGGAQRFGERLATDKIASAPEQPVVLCCWRGGMRSRSVAYLLRELGLARACVLDGGYRAWRALVLADLEAFVAPPTFVLRGFTGVGKTLVLRELEHLRPRSTLDLEALAQHRSSILGMVGLAPVTQKAFESRMRERIVAGFDAELFVEGESRKVGDVIVPARVWSALDGGVDLDLEAPVERRVQVLLDDYLAHPGSMEELVPRLAFLDERLGVRPTLVERFQRGEHEAVVRLLLERYYDPLYRHTEQGRRYAARFDASDPVLCARAIAAWVDARPTEGASA
ncbi:MAG: tRNA 2-selenouridine(34) synthase MnmH [Planctomycetes bacterium]|nr:tRNA 2-selenouridine(34) synthase MnmH [Planctomycetota bacterium]